MRTALLFVLTLFTCSAHAADLFQRFTTEFNSDNLLGQVRLDLKGTAEDGKTTTFYYTVPDVTPLLQRADCLLLQQGNYACKFGPDGDPTEGKSTVFVN